MPQNGFHCKGPSVNETEETLCLCQHLLMCSHVLYFSLKLAYSMLVISQTMRTKTFNSLCSFLSSSTAIRSVVALTEDLRAGSEAFPFLYIFLLNSRHGGRRQRGGTSFDMCHYFVRRALQT